MKQLRETIRRIITETIEFEDKFKHLMGTPAGIHQALELAESLGIPSTELPWTFDSVLNYLKAEYDPSRKGHKIPLESTTGWEWERFWEEHSRN